MEKLLGILSAISLFVGLIFAIGLMLLPSVLNIEISDKFASAIFIPFGLTFILAILSNAAGGGEAILLGKTINKRDNSFLYWSLAFLPLLLGVGTFSFGVYQLLKQSMGLP
jgi:hypothetical protein